MVESMCFTFLGFYSALKHVYISFDGWAPKASEVERSSRASYDYNFQKVISTKLNNFYFFFKEKKKKPNTKVQLFFFFLPDFLSIVLPQHF